MCDFEKGMPWSLSDTEASLRVSIAGQQRQNGGGSEYTTTVGTKQSF